MKRETQAALLLVLILAVSVNRIAYSVSMATGEKEERYTAAVHELETYLESRGIQYHLQGIAQEFEELGGHRFSSGLRDYVLVLQKIDNGAFDYEMTLLLETLALDERFKSFLKENRDQGSSIGTVEELQAYTAGRKAEQSGNTGEALTQYRKCISFFDTRDRYKQLQEGKDAERYTRAVRLLNAEDYAGAWFAFSGLGNYSDCIARAGAIEETLGYVPSNEKDNPQPVSGLRATGITGTQITIVWNRVPHVTQYEFSWRQNGTKNWSNVIIISGAVNEYTVQQLKQNTAYDFSVTAIVGRVKTKPAELLFQKTAVPTPTPLALGSVSNFRVTGYDVTSVSLSWDKTAYAEKYAAEYRKDGAASWTKYMTVTGTSIKIYGLQPDTVYQFKVTALSGTVRGLGKEISVKTAAQTPTPLVLGKVSNLKVAGSDMSSVSLSWSGTANAEQYEIHYRRKGADSWTMYQTVYSTSVRVNDLKPNTTYVFQVTPVSLNVRGTGVMITGNTAGPTPTPKPVSRTPSPKGAAPVDMGHPDLGGKSFSSVFSSANGRYDMNIYIFWVQSQLQAAGYYYGDLTGLFDQTTNSSVRSFMSSRGVSYSGSINQKVIDTIYDYMGSGRVRIEYGGFYHYMDGLMNGYSQIGQMEIIWSNINYDKYGYKADTPYVKQEAYWVQYCLTQLGFDPNGIDGMFGEGCDKAFQAFERAYGFHQKEKRHVYVTYGEARALLEACYHHGVSLSRLDSYKK